jgi:hypothetical protein
MEALYKEIIIDNDNTGIRLLLVELLEW